MDKFFILITVLSLAGSVISSRGPQYPIDKHEEENRIPEFERVYQDSGPRPLGRCVSGGDCNNRTECSVMGMQRFSEPRCEPLGGLGSPCRMYAEPEDRQLSFPDITLECENVYLQFCPCAENLICHEAQCLTKSMVDELERKERNGKRGQVGWARFFH